MLLAHVLRFLDDKGCELISHTNIRKLCLLGPDYKYTDLIRSFVFGIHLAIQVVQHRHVHRHSYSQPMILPQQRQSQ